jgi:hypothetical protein
MADLKTDLERDFEWQLGSVYGPIVIALLGLILLLLLCLVCRGPCRWQCQCHSIKSATRHRVSHSLIDSTDILYRDHLPSKGSSALTAVSGI